MLDRNKMGLSVLEKRIVDLYFKEKGLVLDIGCGCGREAFALNHLHFEVVGIDISPKEIAISRELNFLSFSDIDFRDCNGLDLDDFSNNYFDYIIMWTQNLGNVHKVADRYYLLSEIYRVLTIDGIFSLTVHDYEFLSKNYKGLLCNNLYYPDNESNCYWVTYTVNELRNLILKSGFNILYCDKSKYFVEDKDLGQIVCVCKK